MLFHFRWENQEKMFLSGRLYIALVGPLADRLLSFIKNLFFQSVDRKSNPQDLRAFDVCNLPKCRILESMLNKNSAFRPSNIVVCINFTPHYACFLTATLRQTFFLHFTSFR